MPRPPFNLLLVEDEQADALMFQEMIDDTSPDVQLHHVVNGHEAMRFLRRETGYEGSPRPDLIVLDLNMPVMSGHEFLEQAKGVESIRSIPVLVLSTSDTVEDIHRSYDSQASGYVIKPGTYAEYVKVMTTIQAYWQGVVSLPRLADLADMPG